MKYIIEHLEDEMYPWCIIEYEQISRRAGKDNILFTNVPKKDQAKIKKFGETTDKSVLHLKLERSCLLDPKAEKTLTPADAKRFYSFIFGGILGDHPERGRTEKYLTSKLKGVETRNLGKKQMSTDTAVLATKLVLQGKRIEQLEFKDSLALKLKKGKIHEEVILPYRYVILEGKPAISKKLVNYLKKKQDL